MELLLLMTEKWGLPFGPCFIETLPRHQSTLFSLVPHFPQLIRGVDGNRLTNIMIDIALLVRFGDPHRENRHDLGLRRRGDRAAQGQLREN